MEDVNIIDEACEGVAVTVEGGKSDNRLHAAKLMDIYVARTCFSYLHWREGSK